MIDNLDALESRFSQLEALITDPATLTDMKRYSQLNKEYKALEKVMIVYRKFIKIKKELEGAKEVLKTESDVDFKALAKQEIETLEVALLEHEDALKLLLIPKDPNDNKNVILEIRAGTGGDEASIFAGDIFRMYMAFAERQNWKTAILNFNEGTSGGFKEIATSIEGEDVYAKLKFESGVHRVQRVPDTESQGRVHTSAATVAVLPEAEEVDIDLNLGDVRKDTFRASGAGGQHINKTESAVRLTHHPTGIVVECQEGRSQHANYDKALKVLRARLYEQEVKKYNEEISKQRKSMVGSGDRSDKIRTYNYPQGRVTDHRITFSIFNLPNVMGGGIDEFVEQLRIAETKEIMKGQTE